MTSIPAPAPGARKLGLVIDLDTCVGCQACVVNCKEWNAGGYPAPLSDAIPLAVNPGDPTATWGTVGGCSVGEAVAVGSRVTGTEIGGEVGLGVGVGGAKSLHPVRVKAMTISRPSRPHRKPERMRQFLKPRGS